MKHDIEAINSAIRLGDKVLPPEGCKIKYFGFIVRIWINGVVISVHSYCLIDTIDGCTYAYYPTHDKDLEILSIPDNAPPFEEWKRLNDT